MGFKSILRVIFRIGAVLFLVAGFSCRRDAVDTIPRFPERQFTNSWTMEQTVLARFKERANEISVGDDISRVIGVVGAPDKDETSEKNERVRVFVYYATRQRADSAIDSDRVVIIGFNRHAKVTRIYSNVEGIPSKNWFPD